MNSPLYDEYLLWGILSEHLNNIQGPRLKLRILSARINCVRWPWTLPWMNYRVWCLYLQLSKLSEIFFPWLYFWYLTSCHSNLGFGKKSISLRGVIAYYNWGKTRNKETPLSRERERVPFWTPMSLTMNERSRLDLQRDILSKAGNTVSLFNPIWI